MITHFDFVVRFWIHGTIWREVTDYPPVSILEFNRKKRSKNNEFAYIREPFRSNIALAIYFDIQSAKEQGGVSFVQHIADSASSIP